MIRVALAAKVQPLQDFAMFSISLSSSSYLVYISWGCIIQDNLILTSFSNRQHIWVIYAVVAYCT